MLPVTHLMSDDEDAAEIESLIYGATPNSTAHSFDGCVAGDGLERASIQIVSVIS